MQVNDGNRGNILAVDDTPNNLRLLSSMLTVLGYKVRSVTEGQMAITAAQSAPPDLILLDITMPDMDGYEVCRLLKANPLTADIPIIFISALDEVSDKVKAFAVGGVDYVTKPFQTEEVLARVENQLILQRLKRQLKEQNEQLQREIQERLRIEEALTREIQERTRAEAALQKANEELRSLALVDGLTQVANRRRFDEYFYQEWQRLTQAAKPMALILCDLDFFKNYNDAEGHRRGDECLQAVAVELKRSVPFSQSLVARYGGEEFAVILPETDAAAAQRVAETIQANLRKEAIPHPQSEVHTQVTVSIGVACTHPHRDKLPDTLISITDQALYQAKAEGRNRIVVREY